MENLIAAALPGPLNQNWGGRRVVRYVDAYRYDTRTWYYLAILSDGVACVTDGASAEIWSAWKADLSCGWKWSVYWQFCQGMADAAEDADCA